MIIHGENDYISGIYPWNNVSLIPKNRKKNKNNLTISVDAGKASDKIQHSVMIKTLSKL